MTATHDDDEWGEEESFDEMLSTFLAQLRYRLTWYLRTK